MAESIWNKCLRYIRDNLEQDCYEKWFLPIVPLKFEDNVFTIQVPSELFSQWLEEHYIDLIKSAFTKFLGENVQLMYNVKQEAPAAHKNGNVLAVGEKKAIPFGSQVPKKKYPSMLNSKYAFDTFIKGNSNELALNAGLTIAKNPGKTSFNPLFLYAKVGLGKTHLINAIGLEVEKNYPQKQVLYLSADRFVQQFIVATRNNQRNDFIHFYQNVEVLIIDDIQFFSGKKKTQGVFFEIFNHLHHNNKQVILASDRSPVDMETRDIQEHLISRFKWGMSAELTLPEMQTRVAILNRKILSEGVAVPEKVVEYLAKHIRTNIRELEGAMTSLIGRSSLLKIPYSVDLAQRIVNEYVGTNKKTISVEEIIKVVCGYYKIGSELFHSKSRLRHIVKCRQVAMYFGRKLSDDSLANIGYQIGNKNHATVLHACKTVKNNMDYDRKFRIEIEEIHQKILY